MNIVEKYVSKSSSTASRIIEDEAVIVLPNISKVTTLNKVATRIWDMADGSKKIFEIINELQQEYDAEPAQIKNDSIDFINKMLTEKMLVISDQPLESFDD